MTTNQSTSSDTNPRIQLSATLSPSTLSLSSCTPSAPPIYSNLHVKLIDSSAPITILLSNSALSQTAQSFYRSYYDLTSQSTGHHPRQRKVYGILTPHVVIEDPQSEILTLYPDGPAADMSIQIGVQVSPWYHERSAEGADTRPDLAVAATQLSGLEAGVGYEVGLKNINGEMPVYVWWWERGQKEDVVQKSEARGFGVPVCGIGTSGMDENLRVEMEEKPILRVVE